MRNEMYYAVTTLQNTVQSKYAPCRVIFSIMPTFVTFLVVYLFEGFSDFQVSPVKILMIALICYVLSFRVGWGFSLFIFMARFVGLVLAVSLVIFTHVSGEVAGFSFYKLWVGLAIICMHTIFIAVLDYLSYRDFWNLVSDKGLQSDELVNYL